MDWKFTFAVGFIYSSFTVWFGWILSRLTSLSWFFACIVVVLADLTIRNILSIAAKAYLK